MAEFLGRVCFSLICNCQDGFRSLLFGFVIRDLPQGAAGPRGDRPVGKNNVPKTTIFDARQNRPFLTHVKNDHF